MVPIPVILFIYLFVFYCESLFLDYDIISFVYIGYIVHFSVRPVVYLLFNNNNNNKDNNDIRCNLIEVKRKGIAFTVQ